MKKLPAIGALKANSTCEDENSNPSVVEFPGFPGDAGCDTSSGSGTWLACTEANGGELTDSGCFLSGSGVSGETVPCVCR